MISGALAIADSLLGTMAQTATNKDATAFELTCEWVATTVMGITYNRPTGKNVSAANTAMAIKAAILAQFNEITAVCAYASANGYVLPDNPLPRFNQLNASRRYGAPLGITADEDNQLANATQQLSVVASQYAGGQRTFNSSAPGSQISSFETSVDGISSQTGDPLGDVLSYQPDQNSIALKQGLDNVTLQVGFTNQRPYFLFIADIITSGKRQNGTIVCWRAMPGATAYTISKRDVFGMVNLPDTTLDAASLAKSTSDLRADRNFQQLLSFYDWVGPNDYLAYVDESNNANTVYAYTLTGLQTQVPAPTNVFAVPTSALVLSSAQVGQVQSLILQDLRSNGAATDIDSVSPYPALAQVIYGDPGYGWILAGCNVLASQQRGDTPPVTLGYSYIGSRASNILAAAASGKLVAPSDVSTVTDGVTAQISALGVSQVILSVLNGTGVSSFISGQGSQNPTGNALVTLGSLQNAVGGLAKIVSAIDMQTETLDPQTLIAGLTVPTGAPTRTIYSARPIGSAVGGNVTAASIQSIVGSAGPLDLTTYLGIDSLMVIIRSLYDFYPSTLS